MIVMMISDVDDSLRLSRPAGAIVESDVESDIDPDAIASSSSRGRRRRAMQHCSSSWAS